MSTRPVVLRDHGYLDLPGVSGAVATTPHHADFLFSTGTLDLRCEFFQPAAGGSSTLLSRWRDAGNQRSYRLTTVSVFAFNGIVWSVTGGSDTIPTTSTTPAVPLNPGAYRATLETDVGGSWRARHYLAETLDHPWSLLHEQVTAPQTSVFTGATVPLLVGAINDGTFQFWTGRVYHAQLWVNGTLRADPDFRRLATGTTAFVDSTGKPWSVVGGASVVGGRDLVTL